MKNSTGNIVLTLAMLFCVGAISNCGNKSTPSPLIPPTMDANYWHIPTYLYNGDGTYVGQTQFRCSQNAPLPSVINGDALINLDTYNPIGFSFYGTDVITNQSFTLVNSVVATVTAKLVAPIPAGIVAGIFFYYPPANSILSTNHDEIDFEFLSDDLGNVHTNIFGNEPLGVGHPTTYAYPSGSATDYHIYQIQWLPKSVSWYVDGILIRTVTTQSPIPVGPMYFHLNMWVPDSSFTAAYNPNLTYTTSPSADQTYSLSVDMTTFPVTSK